jgi:glycosyltransferase involved in cell wall biosynthesis
MIYFVAKNIGLFGGAAVVAMDVADSFVHSGINFKAICSMYKVPEDKGERLAAVERLKMPYVPEKNDYPSSVSGRLRYYLKDLQNHIDWWALNAQLRKNPPKLMIFNGYKPSTMAVINEYSTLCKTIHIVHVSPNYVDTFEDFISLNELLEVYGEADALIFVSDECRKAWMKYDVIDERHAHYIPNCAKEEEAKGYLNHSKADTRKKLGLKADSFYLVNVAGIKKRKGQDLLIEAAPELKKIAPNIEILIIGSGEGSYFSELERNIDQHKIDFIHFLGHRINAMEYVYASDLFVLPSRAEAFPLAILEAMILKTPVIGSNVDGVPEMIIPDQTGLLFESENVGDLVRTFEKMYRNPRMRQEFAKNASEKYWSDFSKGQFTYRYLNLINNYTV